MSSVCLLDLPVEILHRIFDYLDTKTIVCSLRCVCNRLYELVNTYNQFELNLTSPSKFDVTPVFQVVRPENVTSLIFSAAESSKESDRIEFLLAIFDIQQLTRLRSLTLHGVNDVGFDRLLQRIMVLPLTSFAIRLRNLHESTSLALLSTAITQWNLRKLHLIDMSFTTRIPLWPRQCTLKYLKITNCYFEGYQVFLEHSPSLRTLVIENCMGFSTRSSVSGCYSQLSSLIINLCYFSMDELKLFLASTPSLIHLKLIVSSCEWNPLFDGFHWEEFIQTNLRLLRNFQFCFRHRIRKYYTKYMTLHSIIKSYQTPFWLVQKQWFVTCDYIIKSSETEIMLYTAPEPINDYEMIIRYRALSTNDRCYFTKTFANENNDDLQEEKILTELNLENSKKISADMLYLSCALKHNATLVSLNLDNNEIESSGIEYLVDALQNNTQTLTTLSINGNYIRGEGVQCLAEVLQNNTSITTLNIGGNRIGDEGARQLAYTLQKNTTLTTLNISGNQIGRDGARHLASELLNNQTLVTFDFQANCVGDDGIQHLCDALRKIMTLRTLDFSSNGIDASKAEYLATFLENNTTLTTLNLNDNELGINGVKYLTCALQKNSTLRTLNLRYNHIDDDGAEYLANALTMNTTLATLNLWNNCITGAGVHYLTEALQTNTTLTELNLGRNEIGTTGTKYLADMLRINSVLAILSVWDNNIKEKGAAYLAAALEINRTLTTLDIGFNHIGDDGEQCLLRVLQSNKTLKTVNFEITPMIII